MTRYRKIETETLGDKQGKVKVNALLNAMVDTPGRIVLARQLVM